MQSQLSSRTKLIISIVLCLGGGFASGFFSQSGLNTWYMSINKPSWNPPAFLFGPVWTTLYILMGISLWTIWKSDSPEAYKKKALTIFGVQLFLNFIWSLLFFKFESPAWALVDILLMVVTIITTIFVFAESSKKAAWLLVPYICWVSFASILNYTIWSLN
jgi:translocator protein